MEAKRKEEMIQINRVPHFRYHDPRLMGTVKPQSVSVWSRVCSAGESAIFYLSVSCTVVCAVVGGYHLARMLIP